MNKLLHYGTIAQTVIIISHMFNQQNQLCSNWCLTGYASWICLSEYYLNIKCICKNVTCVTCKLLSFTLTHGMTGLILKFDVQPTCCMPFLPILKIRSSSMGFSFLLPVLYMLAGLLMAFCLMCPLPGDFSLFFMLSEVCDTSMDLVAFILKGLPLICWSYKRSDKLKVPSLEAVNRYS